MPNQNDFKIIPTQILESVPSAILITDKETTEIVDVNTNFELLSGFSKQELIGNRTKDLNLWVDWNMRERMVGQLRENSHFTGVPMQLRKKSNQIIIAMCSGSYFQTNGKDYFMLYLLALADNEELKERVSVSEQNFKILFEKSPILMAISELTSGRFIECNEAFNKVTEFEREEIIGKNVFELNLWDNPDDRRRIMEGVSHDLKFMEEKFRFWSKNRKELWGLCSFTRIQYGGVDCLLASIKDITESKMIEDRNQFQEAIVTYLFDNISDPIFAKDVNGRILLCNEAMSQMIGGYHKSQVIGKLQSDLVFGDTLKELIQDDQKVYERDDTVESEIRFVKGSSTHYMLSKKSPWHDSEGNLKGLIGLARDITKHKDLELELRYKIDRKDKLFRILAHDLRGPMGSVSQLLELIIEKIPEDSDIAELLTMAYRSSNQTFNLLENLLGWIAVSLGYLLIATTTVIKFVRKRKI